MDSLRGSDARLLGETVARLSAVEELAAFRAELLALLRALIPCELASYNEIGDDPSDVFVAADPEGAQRPELLEAFAAFAAQNPLVTAARQDARSTTLRLSDFITPRRLRSLDLFEHVYRHVGVEHQLAFTVPSRRRVVGVTVSRTGRDFDGRELELLEAVRGIVLLAHRGLHDRAQLEALIDAVEYGDGSPIAVVFLDEREELWAAHARAEDVLQQLAEEPEALRRLYEWARSRRDDRAGYSDVADAPLQLMLARGSLEARYVRGSSPKPDAITIRLYPTQQAATLCSLGLTRRQADVLFLVWQGLTNVEIARRLNISAHTVRHHLEGVYGRLGVTTRSAAAHVAGNLFAGRVAPARATC